MRKLHAILLIVIAIAAIPAFADKPVDTGSIQTTDAGCSRVNGNIYLWKGDVYLNGGPSNPSSDSGLAPGQYWVQVTDPSGSVILGTSGSANITVDSTGHFAACYKLWDLVGGYATTPNPGGEYKVAVSMDSSFDPSITKYDNFKVDDPTITVEKTCTPDVFLNDMIDYTVTVRNTGRVQLDNVVVTDSVGGTLTLPLDYNNALTTTGTYSSYTWTFAGPASATGTLNTTTHAEGTDLHFNYVAMADTSCSTNVWALATTKTASTSYSRNWTWTLSETADDPSPITVTTGNSAPVHFTITATATATDSNWAISGTVTVHNPAPIAATVASVSDTLSDSTAVSLDCGGSGPFTIAAGGDLTCTYTIARSGPAGGTNSASATLSNNNGGTTDFSGSAAYAFGNPSATNECATVTGTGLSILNPDNTPSSNWTISGTIPTQQFCAPSGGPSLNGTTSTFTLPYTVTVTNVNAECASIYPISTGSNLTGPASLNAGAGNALSTGPCPGGCTLTIGFWKTHAGFTGRNPNVTGLYLPQLLGNFGGPKTVTVSGVSQAVSLLQMSGDASNGINKLYAQLLAAKLNVARGASASSVASTMSAADNFLSNNDGGAWSGLSKTVRANVTSWMSTLDAFNNGTIGPGHCN